MAKANKKNGTSTPTFGKVQGKCRPVWGSLFFVLGVFVLVALVDFHPDQSGFATQPHAGHADYDGEVSPNLVGRIGAETAWGAFFLIGGAAWLLWLAAFYFGYLFFRSSRQVTFLKFFAVFVCLIAASSLLSMQGTLFLDEGRYQNGPGGMLGTMLFDNVLHYNLGVFGSALILSLIFLMGVVLLFSGDLGESMEKMTQRFTDWRKTRAEEKEKRREEKRLLKAEKEKEKKERRKEKEEEKERKKKEKQEEAEKRAKEKKERRLRKDDEDELADALPEVTPEDQPPSRPTRRPPEKKPEPAAAPRLTRRTPSEEETPAQAKPAVATTEARPKVKVYKSEEPKKAAFAPPKAHGDYQFPTLDLLSVPEAIKDDDVEDHEEKARLLVHTLQTFGVEATVDEIHVGPVITRFDILPAPGTKVSKIQGLENDIAMGLKALAVRILAPVPGKGCVGVEIPNRTPQPVSLREIIESEDWNNSRAEIPIGLGKDVSGKPLVADLTKMPHLLIAGSTGSGKTVCINSVIASLLYHSTPDRLRFIMVDPKIVEMKIYNDLPHMLIPVVTEPKKVPGALKWLINEMERRYQVFASVGVRNISGFHAHIKKEAAKKPEPDPASESEHDLGHLPEAIAPEVEVPRDEELDIPKNMPYIVCIIDELADLMMVAPADIETAIARLAQLARAAGIHLILATQRPSVNVITGVIKANLPSRIAFKVASKIDSRTILDAGGADQLIGKGDMLFLPPGTARLIRSQGAFVSDDEITSIVDFLKQNGGPVYAEEIQREIDQPEGEEGGGFGGDEDDDELFSDAIDVLRTTRRASTSMLQRKLRIGYNRAARLMELLEDRGIVGPENGAQPREILIDPDSL